VALNPLLPATVDRHLAPSSMRVALEADVRAGLTATPKTLPPKWFYDARGSVLFDQITRLPEYYPFRCERAILVARAGEIVELSGADTLIELGSGTSEKTRLLLAALHEAGTLRRFVPFDVDETVLLQASREIGAAYPDVAVHAVVGDFEHHLPLLPRGGRRLIAFLGGTIGNLLPGQRAEFLRTLAQSMASGDSLLVGTDLVKDEQRLVRAYDDQAGVTAQFNLNVLNVLNRELGSDLDVEAFAHVAAWCAEDEWIEMRLRSLRPQVARVLDLEVHFAEGEQIRTEISAKFRPAGIAGELAAAGLTVTRFWTDADGDFGLSLAHKP
jgi:L-histidine N-alpha-methyltransferase